MGQDFSGIVGAPVTPFKENNTVDYDTFAKQLNFLVEHGVSLIAHPMHIGESINLTVEERKDLARCLAEAVSGRVPTFVHVSFGGTDQAADLAQHSRKVGATGVVLMAPYHWRSNREAILEHVTTVADQSDAKLILYNNPKATNVEITPDILAVLFERLPRLVGLKDASFNMTYFTEICRLNAETTRNVAMYTGVEYLLTSMPVGGRGCFSACAEVAPKLVLDLYRACAAVDLPRARVLQYRVARLLSLLMKNYPATIKYAMELMGRPVGQTRKPILPLTSDEKAQAERVQIGRASCRERV